MIVVHPQLSKTIVKAANIIYKSQSTSHANLLLEWSYSLFWYNLLMGIDDIWV